jgi:hypothetical protein
MRKLILIVACFGLALTLACATATLPQGSTFQQKAAAVCSDLDAAVLLAQIGLTAMQQTNWVYDYSKAQQTLVAADTLIDTVCLASKTEGDLLQVRNAVLKALADAQRQQAEAAKWK